VSCHRLDILLCHCLTASCLKGSASERKCRSWSRLGWSGWRSSAVRQRPPAWHRDAHSTLTVTVTDRSPSPGDFYRQTANACQPPSCSSSTAGPTDDSTTSWPAAEWTPRQWWRPFPGGTDGRVAVWSWSYDTSSGGRGSAAASSKLQHQHLPGWCWTSRSQSLRRRIPKFLREA